MIILKKEVNNLFKEKGIEELTVGTNSKGNITIIGKDCGQPVMTLHNIKVKVTLTRKVREIVIEDYIKPTLDRYLDDIKMYIDLRKKLKQTDSELEKMKNTIKKPYALESHINGVFCNILYFIPDTQDSTVNSRYSNNTQFIGYDIEKKKVEIKNLPEKDLRKLSRIIKTLKTKLTPIYTLNLEVDELLKKIRVQQEKLQQSCGW